MTRRNSVQRQMVLDALKKLSHPTAQDILNEVRKGLPSVSLGTVYRNLDVLAGEGVVQRLSFPDSPERFDILVRPHYHIACSRCGRIFDVDQKYLEEIDRKIEQSTGFSIESHSIYFQGICPLCKERDG